MIYLYERVIAIDNAMFTKPKVRLKNAILHKIHVELTCF